MYQHNSLHMARLLHLLCNILIGCFCIVVLSWAVVAIQTVINDFKREKREEKKAAQDDEYHIKRMESLK